MALQPLEVAAARAPDPAGRSMRVLMVRVRRALQAMDIASQRIAGRLQVKWRLALTAAAVLLPLMVLGRWYVQTSQAQIQAASFELDAMDVIMPLRRLARSLDEHRGLAQLRLNGAEGVESRMQVVARQIDVQFNRLLDRGLAIEPSVKARAMLRSLEFQWQELRGHPDRLNARDSLFQYSSLIKQVHQLLDRLAESSGMAVDARPQAAFLIASIETRGDSAGERIGELRALVAGIAQSGQFDPADRADVLAKSLAAQRGLDPLKLATLKMERLGPSHVQRIATGMKEADRKLRLFLNQIDRLLKHEASSPLGMQLLSLGGAAIDEINAVHDASDELFRSTLDATVSQLRADQVAMAAWVGAAALLAAVLAFVVARSVAAPIGHLTRVVERLARGDAHARALIRSDDEIGRLAQRFDELIEERERVERALRRSEQRFRSLTELSADWYWEQDAELRFTELSTPAFDKSGYAVKATLGKRRWEVGKVTPLSCTWEQHRALLEAHQPFVDFVYRRLGQDGRMRVISVSGEPFFDDDGRFMGYRGIGRDVGDHVEHH